MPGPFRTTKGTSSVARRPFASGGPHAQDVRPVRQITRVELELAGRLE